ncbi:MAG: phosphoribosylformylglycinamidine cyclo-ligase [Oscillospiraceae bacterium]|nr:phosphoribosylformylglycinamidine cyclo-ligase [Oscillospiraceae bacterium]
MSDNTQNHTASYAAAGVDVTAGYRAVELMKKHVERTKIPGVLEGIGGFGGLFAPALSGVKEPVLVSGTDGVGTKIRVAQLAGIHDRVGIDLVAMCANDVVCAGARPLFFLDYIAVGKNIPEKVAQIVAGVAEGCVRAGCALLGGETAEHPGTMQPEDYDLAGFCVGIVDKGDILTTARVKAGDVIIALPSSGLHSNGFSLVRKVFDVEKGGLDIFYPELGKTLGEELLIPTRIYTQTLAPLLAEKKIHTLAHITGGGFYENIPRALPDGLGAVIERAALRVPPIFDLIAKAGNIPEQDMFGTFNMGVGICATVDKADTDAVLTALPDAYIIGDVRSDDAGVVIR